MIGWLQEFATQVADVDPAWLATALVLHVASLCFRGLAWSAIVAEAAAGRVDRRGLVRAYLAGIGLSAVTPARVGALARLVLARPAAPGTSYFTLAPTMAVEAAFNAIAGAALLAWAMTTDRIPGPASLAGFVAGKPVLAAVAGLLAVALLVVLLSRQSSRLSDLATKLRRGFAVLGRPRTYVRRVALWQAADWLARLASLYWFARSFGLPDAAESALLIQVALSLAALAPVLPAGLGTKEALLGLVLAGVVPLGVAFSFGIFLNVAHALVDVLLGAAALAATLRAGGLRPFLEELGRLRRRGREAQSLDGSAGGRVEYRAGRDKA